MCGARAPTWSRGFGARLHEFSKYILAFVMYAMWGDMRSERREGRGGRARVGKAQQHTTIYVPTTHYAGHIRGTIGSFQGRSLHVSSQPPPKAMFRNRAKN